MAVSVGRSDGESVWKRKFDEITELPLYIPAHRHWQLRHVSKPPSHARPRPFNWKQYKTKGMVSFLCKTCGRFWCSVNGVVIFYYRQRRTQFDGEVRMWLMRQNCKRCFRCEDPEWSSSEIFQVLCRLLAKIEEKFYGREKRSFCRPWRGNMNGPHLSYLCEACQQGVCTEDDLRMNRFNFNEVEDYV